MKKIILLAFVIVLSVINLTITFSPLLFGAGGGGKACTATASCSMPVLTKSCSCPGSGGTCIGECTGGWVKVNCVCDDPRYSVYDSSPCSQCGSGGAAY